MLNEYYCSDEADRHAEYNLLHAQCRQPLDRVVELNPYRQLDGHTAVGHSSKIV